MLLPSWPSRVLTPTTKGLAGIILLLGLVALGILARTSALTHHDLHVDQVLQHYRFPLATGFFLALTDAASEIAGVAALLIGIVTLVARKRRWDAFRLAVMAGSAWVLAIGVKDLIARPRPPASLWALVPDSSGSFPSGHDTTACVVVLVVLMALNGTLRARIRATAAAVAFAVAVGASRIYLGDHYPTDVLGSWLAVSAAAVLVWAVTDLPAVRRVAAAVLRDPRATPAPVPAP